MKRLIFFIGVCCFGFCRFSWAQDYPQRIISLGPAITENLYILGAQDKMIANTIYCRTPQGKEKKEKIGTVIKINLERIVELKPDLVLATSLTDRAQLEAMKNLSIRVVEIPGSRDFAEVCGGFLELARLIGQEKDALRLIKQVKAEVDFVVSLTQGLPKPKVIVQIGSRPLFVATQEYAVNDFVKLAGGINLTENMVNGLYSREEALRQNPEVIIITTMGVIGEDEKRLWYKYKSLEAVKNKRVHIVDEAKLCAPTVLSFPGTLREMAEILHPIRNNYTKEVLL